MEDDHSVAPGREPPLGRVLGVFSPEPSSNWRVLGFIWKSIAVSHPRTRTRVSADVSAGDEVRTMPTIRKTRDQESG